MSDVMEQARLLVSLEQQLSYWQKIALGLAAEYADEKGKARVTVPVMKRVAAGKVSVSVKVSANGAVNCKVARVSEVG